MAEQTPQPEDSKETDEDCVPCRVGVILGITKYVCEQQGGEESKSCEELYQKAVMGEIPIKDYIAEVKKKVKDPQDLKTLENVEEVMKDFKLGD